MHQENTSGMRSWDKGLLVTLVTVTFSLLAPFIDPKSWVICMANTECDNQLRDLFVQAASCGGATKGSLLLRNAGTFSTFPSSPALFAHRQGNKTGQLCCRGIAGSTHSVPRREGRCPRAGQFLEEQQGTAA